MKLCYRNRPEKPTKKCNYWQIEQISSETIYKKTVTELIVYDQYLFITVVKRRIFGIGTETRDILFRFFVSPSS